MDNCCVLTTYNGSEIYVHRIILKTGVLLVISAVICSAPDAVRKAVKCTDNDCGVCC
jgi:hypothetical protein